MTYVHAGDGISSVGDSDRPEPRSSSGAARISDLPTKTVPSSGAAHISWPFLPFPILSDLSQTHRSRCQIQERRRWWRHRTGGRAERGAESYQAPAMGGAAAAVRLLLLCLLAFYFAGSHQQSDSCGEGVPVAHLVPFNSSAFHCAAIWKQEDFILRYKNTGPSQWSFLLSAPDKGSYVAVGFSGKGLMVGSSAVVGWASGGKGVIKQYYLVDKSPDEVLPNEGRLTLVKKKAVLVSDSGRLYLAFQLSTDRPQPHLIYAVGPYGALPSADSVLQMHRNMGSRAFNYSGMASNSADGSSSDAAGFRPERLHGLLSMMGWGVLMPLGMLVARYFRRQDPYWFYGHMAIQGVAFLVGIAAVILGFRLNERGIKNVLVHKALGIAILSMASLQVTAVLARPDKTSKVRRFWNWYHHSIGRAAIVVAMANVFVGLTIAQEVSAYVVSYGVFVAVWVVAVAAFEIKRRYDDDDDIDD